MLPNRSWEMRVSVDAQADMLSAEASSAMCVQKFDDSRTVCRSHYVSHLAAFFIVARAKISVVESYQFGSASAKSVSSRAAYSASFTVPLYTYFWWWYHRLKAHFWPSATVRLERSPCHAHVSRMSAACSLNVTLIHHTQPSEGW